MIATIGVTEDDLVTGEAVALDLPPASIGLRILSGLLDLVIIETLLYVCLLYTSPSPRDRTRSRMPSSA